MQPTVTLKPKEERRIKAGHPWIYSNEIKMDPATKGLPLGTRVRVQAHDGAKLGIAHFNPRTLIAARLLSRHETEIDTPWYASKITNALNWRERMFASPYYRLVHAEADDLPGLIIDRFDKVCVIQPNTAGMQHDIEKIIAALNQVIHPEVIVIDGESSARLLEGLPQERTLAQGQWGIIKIPENGVVYVADLQEGQKTGWYFDQRAHRAYIASHTKNKSLLDVCCYSGGFALAAAKHGASRVLAVDRSGPALALLQQAAQENKLSQITTQQGDAFDVLEELASRGERFDTVVIDPPPFARSRKEVPTALKGYRKLAKLAAQCVSTNGILFAASCSHAITRDAFAEECVAGIKAAGCYAAEIYSGACDSDHPVHAHLPETAYLKALAYRVRR